MILISISYSERQESVQDYNAETPVLRDLKLSPCSDFKVFFQTVSWRQFNILRRRFETHIDSFFWSKQDEPWPRRNNQYGFRNVVGALMVQKFVATRRSYAFVRNQKYIIRGCRKILKGDSCLRYICRFFLTSFGTKQLNTHTGGILMDFYILALFQKFKLY